MIGIFFLLLIKKINIDKVNKINNCFIVDRNEYLRLKVSKLLCIKSFYLLIYFELKQLTNKKRYDILKINFKDINKKG